MHAVGQEFEPPSLHQSLNRTVQTDKELRLKRAPHQRVLGSAEALSNEQPTGTCLQALVAPLTNTYGLQDHLLQKPSANMARSAVNVPPLHKSRFALAINNLSFDNCILEKSDIVDDDCSLSPSALLSGVSLYRMAFGRKGSNACNGFFRLKLRRCFSYAMSPA